MPSGEMRQLEKVATMEFLWRLFFPGYILIGGNVRCITRFRLQPLAAERCSNNPGARGARITVGVS